MEDQICIVNNTDIEFLPHLNSLIEKCEINPIYSSNFADYYEEIKIQQCVNKSVLFTLNNLPIAAFIFTQTLNPSVDDVVISYFGLPAPFIKVPNLKIEILDECISILLQYLNDNNIKVKKGKILDSFSISINPGILSSNRLEKFLFNGSKVIPRFNRIIDLGKGKESIKSNYSKTVVESVSKNDLDLQIIDKDSERRLIGQEITNLRFLHMESAGRQTRSEKSWQLQSEMIARGNGFLISGYRNEIIQTSAFFMINLNSVFYGVSASTACRSGESFSHNLIDFGIDYLCKNNFHKLWLGTQYSHLLGPVTLKEKNIELFKSFFGGELILDLVLGSVK
jgi:hypothetical protein